MNAKAQKRKATHSAQSNYTENGKGYVQLLTLSDTLPEGAKTIKFITRDVCKHFNFIYLMESQAVSAGTEMIIAQPVEKRVPILKITGNILYDVNYRSRVDTPYAENNVFQHTLQTRIDAVYKDRYPFRIYVTTRFGNSSLFRKYTDLNFQFNQADFQRRLKMSAMNAIESFAHTKSRELDSLSNKISKIRAAIEMLNQFLSKTDITQKIVEEREKLLFQQQMKAHSEDLNDDLSKTDIRFPQQREFKFLPNYRDTIESKSSSLTAKHNSGFSHFQTFQNVVAEKKSVMDSLISELEKAESLYRKLKAIKQVDVNEGKKQIEGSREGHELLQKLRELKIPDSVLPKGYKSMLAIQTFSIGRSNADYSELSVRNISITGLQVEFNPRYYYALAVGRVDYRFRDYIVPSQRRSNQYVALARFGRGTKFGNHLFFTYYAGKRQFFNSTIAMQPNSIVPEYKLAGMTLEGQIKVNRNIFLIGEVAKSTTPYYGRDSLIKKNWINSISDFNDRSNEAYSAKLISYFPASKTRVTGNLRYTGANFQSFSTFTSGAAQLRWSTKIEQSLFKRQLTIISSLQQNDYQNPFVNTAYKSSSLLASFQANLRVRKWPTISFGYFPSYQLTKVGDDHYSESRYYTMTGTIGYYYKVRTVQMNSLLVYSQFYNSASDSGFVYYNSRNVLVSHNILLNRYSITTNASVSVNTDYNIYSMENAGQLALNKWVTAGVGLKTIKQSSTNSLYWGYSGTITVKLLKLGDFQILFDKSFIPGVNRILTENKMGRLMYYKTF